MEASEYYTVGVIGLEKAPSGLRCGLGMLWDDCVILTEWCDERGWHKDG